MYEGAPNCARLGPLLAASSSSTASRSSTRRRPRSARSSAPGDEWPKKTRSLEPAPPRHRRRADQPRGVDLVPPRHRRRPLPDRRHVVADRDRLDHDDDAARARATRSPARRACRSSASYTDGRDKDGDDGAARTRAASSSSRRPWPSMLRTLWGDDERFRKQYWSDVPGRATSPATARAATRTATSGSSAASTTCSTSPAIASAPPRSRARSCRTRPSPRPPRSAGPTSSRARRSSCSSRCKPGHEADDATQRRSSREHVDKEIGKFARPDAIRFTDALPKTRSGKIMRRLLKDVAAGTRVEGRHLDARGPQRPREAPRRRGVMRESFRSSGTPR